MSDPLFPIPIVRSHANYARDEYGEAWTVLDGIETKIPSIAAAKELLTKQDKVRVDIRTELDALGIRDRTVKTMIKLADGREVEVDMLPPGDGGANVLQFEMDPTPTNITRATKITETLERARTKPWTPPTVLSFWQRLKKRITNGRHFRIR